MAEVVATDYADLFDDNDDDFLNDEPSEPKKPIVMDNDDTRTSDTKGLFDDDDSKSKCIYDTCRKIFLPPPRNWLVSFTYQRMTTHVNLHRKKKLPPSQNENISYCINQ